MIRLETNGEKFNINWFGFREPTDFPPAVSTESPSPIMKTAATLEGTLDDFGGADTTDVYFEWRESSASSWTPTATQTLSTIGAFSEEVSGLSEGTEHEVRALAEANDGDTAIGDTVTFTTDESADNAPVIDSYSVTEAGSPNPHAEITADWTVSDEDGNLKSVQVAVYDSTGRLVDAATTRVSGSDASGTDTFVIKDVDGQTFEVTLTVTDASGLTSSGTQTITE